MAQEEETLRNEIKEEIEKITKLKKWEKEYKNTDIKEMIRYYNSITNDIEARRTRYNEFSLEYAAILAIVLVFIIPKSDSIDQYHIFFIGLIGIQIISAIFAIVLFLFQSKYRYPFLQIKSLSNQWKWFYHGNEPILGIDTRAIFPTKESELTTKPYLRGLKNFVHEYRIEDIDQEITRNIIQLYLLQVHNYYKNRFYLQLSTLGTYSIYTTGIYLLSALVIWIVNLIC